MFIRCEGRNITKVMQDRKQRGSRKRKMQHKNADGSAGSSTLQPSRHLLELRIEEVIDSSESSSRENSREMRMKVELSTSHRLQGSLFGCSTHSVCAALVVLFWKVYRRSSCPSGLAWIPLHRALSARISVRMSSASEIATCCCCFNCASNSFVFASSSSISCVSVFEVAVVCPASGGVIRVMGGVGTLTNSAAASSTSSLCALGRFPDLPRADEFDALFRPTLRSLFRCASLIWQRAWWVNGELGSKGRKLMNPLQATVVPFHLAPSLLTCNFDNSLQTFDDCVGNPVGAVEGGDYILFSSAVGRHLWQTFGYDLPANTDHLAGADSQGIFAGLLHF